LNYLLDTNTVIAIFKDTPTIVRVRYEQSLQDGDAVMTSAVVLFELWYGVARSGRWQENAQRLRDFAESGIEIAAFEPEDAQAAGELRRNGEAL